MEAQQNLNIHDVRILRLIAEQAKAARKADGIDDEYARDKRLCLIHLEYAAEALIDAIEVENGII